MDTRRRIQSVLWFLTIAGAIAPVASLAAQEVRLPVSYYFFGDPAVRTGHRERLTVQLGGGAEVPFNLTTSMNAELGYLFVGRGTAPNLTVSSVNATYRHRRGLFATSGYTRSLSGRTFNAWNIGTGMNFPLRYKDASGTLTGPTGTLRFEYRAYYEIGGDYSFRAFRFGYQWH